MSFRSARTVFYVHIKAYFNKKKPQSFSQSISLSIFHRNTSPFLCLTALSALLVLTIFFLTFLELHGHAWSNGYATQQETASVHILLPVNNSNVLLIKNAVCLASNFLFTSPLIVFCTLCKHF
ncbi:uncharacterized protein B0P05DRAFT_626892 [Gilbertella persicaria]|uniref:uncharacterized protein n=1 Tax=Gilbertella persicaria TaxID=101096 RepID=UPI0022211E17|nr:uncharacterized protein B0P05DRAFT_626892 [Gilbertella persicaria]KAI8055562.1 hypothetical protein B0P05DRAFT_626892 [Gilbertella persicaria]